MATHKSVALTVEVPQEYAQALVAAFGWPTRVSPVSVAIARLAGEAIQEKGEGRKKEHWADMAPSKQAAILCQDPEFRAFMAERSLPIQQGVISVEDGVRMACGVTSRADIDPDGDSGHWWRCLMLNYGDWIRRRRGER